MRYFVSTLLIISILACNITIFASNDKDFKLGYDEGFKFFDTEVNVQDLPPEELAPNIQKVNEMLDKLSDYGNKYEEDLFGKYADIKGHWSSSYIGKLVYVGIMGGYSDNTLKPEKTVSVAEFIVMTINALGYSVDKSGTYTHWAQPFINKAIELKVINKDEFSNPDKSLSRQEMASIATRAAVIGIIGPTVNFKMYIEDKVKDINTVTSSYKDFVLGGYALGLFGGSNGMFNPNSILKRSEAAVVIYKLLDKSSRVEFAAPDEDKVLLNFGYWGEERYYYKNRNEEIVDVMKKLKGAEKLTEGYIHYSMNYDSETIGYVMHESEEKLMDNETTLEYDIDFNIEPYAAADYNNMLYIIDIRKPENFYRHLGFFEKLAEVLFENEKDIFIANLEDYIDKLMNNENFYENLIINNRKVHAYDASSEGVIWIYRK